MALGRPILVSDEEVLARARSVFLERGYSASTLRIAAAVGLSWGAIARRFESKRQLFRQAMSGPMFGPGNTGPESAAGMDTDLPGLLERLRSDLWERWPQRLQYRLATHSPEPSAEPGEPPEWLADALRACSRAGVVRSDVDANVLAQFVLTLLVGDVAQRFIAREPALMPDPAFIDRLVCLLGGR